VFDRFALAGATPFLTSARTYLRPPQSADWAEWAELRTESREFLKPWEPTWPHDALSRTSFRRRLRLYARDAREDVGYGFLIFRRGDDALLGGITLSNVRRGVSQCCSIGYWIGKPYARQGHMTDALPAVIRFVFEDLALRRIEAACLPANEPSQKLLLSAGFAREGFARQYLCIDGVWQDHVLFGLLSRDPWRRGPVV
jgi:ribosomal-protein-alanine N-acetyltransferase